ncbi:DUF2905 domain-containing protein [Mycobacterium kansasii]|uniref:DUF2905 domain-containing protein n=3 Tax=Mycobacterium kansasii TaxID=1768 RepID=A0A1V3X822_MYCKA|nr:DUF2905 domain-containing protein [Mycobacterium kansasii]EUA03681.1 hypothetical protein I547_2541 [Mycobacterium kansasii 824]AGZ51482.1 hypothetical protein MKAN_15305 [Mycobacterium kansasii ATCC 12478]ARG56792.1 hypothetical protein B1T43_13995 [Mycobacterium kansasii]ARG62280.1 hypothetical protein B1T45_14340 [Mycobacterium kansasii]ARG69902.1 hypothetical protein B1T47_13560 [Mycobacterium kansasii]
MGRNVGPFLVVAGIIIAVLGVLTWVGGLWWVGRLPGDIRIERGNVRIYVPVVSMLVISIVGSVVLTILLHLFRR